MLYWLLFWFVFRWCVPSGAFTVWADVDGVLPWCPRVTTPQAMQFGESLQSGFDVGLKLLPPCRHGREPPNYF